VALLVTILVRTIYVAPLLAGLKSRASRGERMKPWIAATRERLDDPEAAEKASDRFGKRRMPSVARMDRFRTRLRRLVADIDYLLAQPLVWREGPSSCGPGCATP
jgi:hypothetical protein